MWRAEVVAWKEVLGFRPDAMSGIPYSAGPIGASSAGSVVMDASAIFMQSS